jgi:hypothetical protein
MVGALVKWNFVSSENSLVIIRILLDRSSLIRGGSYFLRTFVHFSSFPYSSSNIISFLSLSKSYLMIKAFVKYNIISYDNYLVIVRLSLEKSSLNQKENYFLHLHPFPISSSPLSLCHTCLLYKYF